MAFNRETARRLLTIQGNDACQCNSFQISFHSYSNEFRGEFRTLPGRVLSRHMARHVLPNRLPLFQTVPIFRSRYFSRNFFDLDSKNISGWMKEFRKLLKRRVVSRNVTNCREGRPLHVRPRALLFEIVQSKSFNQRTNYGTEWPKEYRHVLDLFNFWKNYFDGIGVVRSRTEGSEA